MDAAVEWFDEYRGFAVVRAAKIKEVICHADEDPGVSIEDFAKTSAFQGGSLHFAGNRVVHFDAEFYRKYNPRNGGYLVVYDDGYKSYVSEESFERGYKFGKFLGDAPSEPIVDLHPSVKHVLQYFSWEHLPEHLQAVSKPFALLANQVAKQSPESPETTVALRKLLEAKDAAVRAMVSK